MRRGDELEDEVGDPGGDFVDGAEGADAISEEAGGAEIGERAGEVEAGRGGRMGSAKGVERRARRVATSWVMAS